MVGTGRVLTDGLSWITDSVVTDGLPLITDSVVTITDRVVTNRVITDKLSLTGSSRIGSAPTGASLGWPRMPNAPIESDALFPSGVESDAFASLLPSGAAPSPVAGVRPFFTRPEE